MAQYSATSVLDEFARQNPHLEEIARSRQEAAAEYLGNNFELYNQDSKHVVARRAQAPPPGPPASFSA